MCSVNLLICSTWVISCYFTTHPPDLPIRAHYPTAANTLNLPQASGLDTGIKQPAIKSLLGCKTLEKFTIKRPEETGTKTEGGGLFSVQICRSNPFAQQAK